MPLRIDKYVADALNVSRKQARLLIAKGEVFVNDNLINDPGFFVVDGQDKIIIRGNEVSYQKYHYFLLNKPDGYLSAARDDSEPTVIDLFPGYERAGLFPVGRLDKDTTGVLLVTNDGTLTHRLINPKFGVEKEYLATVNFPLSTDLIAIFARGIKISDDFVALPAKLTLVDTFRAGVVVTEGKYHQIKRMFKALGYEVMALDRISFAGLGVGELAKGQHRKLTEVEISQLFRLVKL